MPEYISEGRLETLCQQYPVIVDPIRREVSLKKTGAPLTERASTVKIERQSPWLQKGSQAPIIDYGETVGIPKRRKRYNLSEWLGNLNPQKYDYYTSPKGIVALNREGIEAALDRRVSLFFQQAIMCHGLSGLKFFTAGADMQLGSASEIDVVCTDGRRTVFKREAAHSSTIPTLKARARDGSTPDGFVFMKRGFGNALHQSTIGMHECVNGADELVDGKGVDKIGGKGAAKRGDGKLRHLAIRILNRTAKGDSTPEESFKSFLETFSQRCIIEIERLESTDPRRKVLKIYRQYADDVREAADAEDFFDNLVGVFISQSTTKEEESLREVVLKRRYQIIREQGRIEEEIGKKIQEIRDQVNTKEVSLVECMLLKDATDREKIFLEKLFGKTVAVYETDYFDAVDREGVRHFNKRDITSIKSFNTRITNLKNKYQANLDVLQRDLRHLFRELYAAELSYRSRLFRDIRRVVKKWTQIEFCHHYTESTGQDISPSGVSRLENLARKPHKLVYKTPIKQRRKILTLSEAERAAQTFKIDLGLFFPALFTSD